MGMFLVSSAGPAKAIAAMVAVCAAVTKGLCNTAYRAHQRRRAVANLKFLDDAFLKTRAETGPLLRGAGFEIEAQESLRDFAIGFFRDAFAKIAAAGGPPPLGLHLLAGANTPQKFSNYLKACEADQIEPVLVVARRL